MTSFKRDGTGIATPLWCVSDEHGLYAVTDLGSPKVRRIRRNPHVVIAPCRADGKLRGGALSAQAEILTAEEDPEFVRGLLLERSSLSYRVVMLVYRVGQRLRGQPSVADGAALAISVD